MPAPAWRLVEEGAPARSGADNMAVDHALFESVQAGGRPALRFYTWKPGCVSLGRNQPAGGRVDRAGLAERGLDLVRRPTGGGAVLHDCELTYAVAVPVGPLGSPRRTYAAVGQALVAGLRRAGVPAVLVPPPVAADRRRAEALVGGVCFSAAEHGEVAAAGGKLVGSAQRCEHRTLLQHGSILLQDGQHVVAELLAERDTGDIGATSLAALLGRVPAPAALAADLAAGFEEALGISLAPVRLSREEHERAARLAALYRSPEWTWRR